MPRDYRKTAIYKLVCKDVSIKDCYVGHTTEFIQRKSKHKNKCNTKSGKNYNLKVYKFIRDNGGWENWSMIEVEKYPCNDEREASAREFYWYDLLDATLNSCIPNRSKQEYRVDYRENNIEKLTTQTLCPCGGSFNYSHKTRHEQTTRHTDYLSNKTQVKHTRDEQIICQCGGRYKYSDKSRHFRTLLHQEFDNSNNI